MGKSHAPATSPAPVAASPHAPCLFSCPWVASESRTGKSGVRGRPAAFWGTGPGSSTCPRTGKNAGTGQWRRSPVPKATPSRRPSSSRVASRMEPAITPRAANRPEPAIPASRLQATATNPILGSARIHPAVGRQRHTFYPRHLTLRRLVWNQLESAGVPRSGYGPTKPAGSRFSGPHRPSIQQLYGRPRQAVPASSPRKCHAGCLFQRLDHRGPTTDNSDPTNINDVIWRCAPAAIPPRTSTSFRRLWSNPTSSHVLRQRRRTAAMRRVGDRRLQAVRPEDTFPGSSPPPPPPPAPFDRKTPTAAIKAEWASQPAAGDLILLAGPELRNFNLVGCRKRLAVNPASPLRT